MVPIMFCRQAFHEPSTHKLLLSQIEMVPIAEESNNSLSAQQSLENHFDAFSSDQERFHPTRKTKAFALFLHHATPDGTQIEIQLLYHFMRQ